MYFLLLCCFCFNIAVFDAKVLARATNQSITVTLYFENIGNCRLSRVALQNEKNSYDVVEHSGMFLTAHLKKPAKKPMDVCEYENLLKQTDDPVFLIITTGNETILRGTLKINNNMFNVKNYKLQLDEKYNIVQVQQAMFYMVYGNRSTLFNRINRRFKRSAIDTKMRTYAENGNNKQKFYLELYLVVDDEFCRQLCYDDKAGLKGCRKNCGADQLESSKCGKLCSTKVRDIVKRVHAYFRQLNIYVVLVGLDFVASENISNYPISFSRNLVRSFQQYLTTNKADAVYDVAHLISNIATDLESDFGSADSGTVCAEREAFGVTVHGATTSVHRRSIAVTHMIARSLNMDYDGSECLCNNLKCIMSIPDFARDFVKASFSDCSKASFEAVSQKAIVYCLKNKPQSIATSYEGFCGNGIVEAGEDCDNGGLYSDICCNMTNCEFKRGSQCASGACCDQISCTFKSPGSVCSVEKNECDVAETCDGRGEWCPEDQYAEDRTPCDNDRGTCYEGQCGSRDLQCKMLYGSEATFGSEDCYDGNLETDPKNGFCKVNWTGQTETTPCIESNKMCGQLHCNVGNLDFIQWPKIRLSPNYKLQTNETAQCRRQYFHMRDDIRSPYMVPNGAPCLTNGVCIDSVCKTIATTTTTESNVVNAPSVPSGDIAENGGSGNSQLIASEATTANSDGSNHRFIAADALQANSANSLKNIQKTTNKTTPLTVHILGTMHELLPKLATNRNRIQMTTSTMMVGLLALYHRYLL